MHYLRLLAIGALCAATLAGLGAQSGRMRGPTDAAAGIDAADFPGFDGAAFALLRDGLGMKAAMRRLAETPDDPANIRPLTDRQRLREALDVLERVIDRSPGRIAEAFSHISVVDFRLDRSQPHGDRLAALTARARERIGTLPPEARATAARRLLIVEANIAGARNWRERLEEFVREHAGTEAALLAEVDAIGARSFNMARLDALEVFARTHPGTAAAAKALWQRGWDLANNASALRIEPRGSDPAPRFLQVVEIVRTLESGAYPPCEWVEKAHELVSGFYMPAPVPTSPANRDAMLAAFRDVVRRRHARDPGGLSGSNIDYVLTYKMADLHELAGRRVAGVEDELAQLERESPAPGAVRLLRAQFYIKETFERDRDRPALIAKAVQTLEALERARLEPYSRRALATLASLRFFDRDYAAARLIYERYLARYPETEWTWLASIRLAQTHAALNDANAAARIYRALATDASRRPFVRALGHAFAAETFAELGRPADAVAHAEAALAGWDDDHGNVYRTQAGQAARPGDEPLALANDTTVEKAKLPARIAELAESARVPGGAALEEGRALLRRGQYADARTRLMRLAADRRGTPLEAPARSLAHRAWLHQALALADVESRTAAPDAALRELERLAAEPLDVYVAIGGIARATLLAMRRAPNADEVMTSALDGWRRQQPVAPAPAAGSVEADVLAIRAAVFKPSGAPIYASANWNAFEFAQGRQSFLLVNPTVPVLDDRGAVQRLTLRQPFADHDNVLFFDDGALEALTAVVRTLGGSARRQRVSPMEIPNQPAGPSLDIVAFWNRFFPMRAGHWSGWDLVAYPAITDIRFQTPERSRAAARVVIGFSGATVILVKDQGVWIARELVNLWVT